MQVMSDIVTPVLQWLNSHPELAGLATFLISALESVAIIGTIVPGSVMMSAIGALVGAGIIPFWSTLIWAILGAIVGDGVSYWLGHFFKDRLHDVWPFRSHPTLLATGEKFFHKYGGMSVFIGRFVGPVRALVPLVAGMLGMTPLRFTVANIASAILWAPVYMLPGFILGAASTELPSELAGRIILMLLLLSLLIILCIWLCKKLFDLIRMELNEFLNWVWNSLKNSRYFYLVTSILKHHDHRKTHGQLTLTFYFIVTCLLFIYLASYIHYNGPSDIFINNFTFHLFRSFRTPAGDEAMMYLTCLGEKFVLLPLAVTAFCWFIWTKRYNTAIHVFLLALLTAFSVHFFKNTVQSPRPWGVNSMGLGFSFPSGHTTIAFTYYFAIAFFLIKIFRIQLRSPIYWFVGILTSSIAISRLYFGVHWLTDIIGGILLSASLLMFITISYNRIHEKDIKPKGIILTLLLTFLISYPVNVFYSYQKLKTAYAILPWPTFQITEDAWWTQQGEHFPLFRVNRFGFSVNVFNVQWVDDLNHIKNILLANGWENPPPRDWLNVLYRISSVQSAEHLPLVSPLYLDQRPMLVLTKTIEGKLTILRFWSSQFILKDNAHPLWLGSVEYAPSTYSWIFKRKNVNDLIPSESLFFTQPPNHYDIKTLIETVKPNSHAIQQTIILIKPKSRS
jgi:membrane protein DedA with SNARE-associated domain/membrane-associated phospholipid phosphatase